MLESARGRLTSPEHLEGGALGRVRSLRRCRGHLFFDLEELEAAPGRPALSVPVAVLGRSAERVLAGLAAAQAELAGCRFPGVQPVAAQAAHQPPVAMKLS